MCKIKMAVDTMVLDKVMLIPDQLLMYDKKETVTLFEDHHLTKWACFSFTHRLSLSCEAHQHHWC